MVDIFDEVSEDLRRDRLQDAWKKYGKYIIAIAILIVVATAGNIAWREYSQTRLEERADQLDAAAAMVREGRTEQALASLEELAETGDEGYAVLVRLRQAAVLMQQGQRDEAIALYDRLAEDPGTDPLYAGLAVVLSVMAQADSGKPVELYKRLAPQLAEGQPWRLTGLEVAAALAFKYNDPPGAAIHLRKILEDPSAPLSLRRRAEELLRVTGG